MLVFHRSSRLRRALLCAVLLAVGLAQTLGLLHRIAHGPHAVQQVADSVLSVPVADAAAPAASTGSWLKTLFAGHDSVHGCEFYDQSSHADLLTAGDSGGSPVPLDAAVATVHSAWHIAAQAAGFLARGPPPIG